MEKNVNKNCCLNTNYVVFQKPLRNFINLKNRQTLQYKQGYDADKYRITTKYVLQMIDKIIRGTLHTNFGKPLANTKR